MDAGFQRLARRGLMTDDEQLTDAGRAFREKVEVRTDELERPVLEAEVTPEAITAMVTMKLRMPMWKARWTYRAALAARGYLVTSSR